METPLWQFWTDWTVKALGTLATFLAAFIALFGPWLRYRIAPPRLVIARTSDEGWQGILRTFDSAGQSQDTKGFWYHVRVGNKTLWNPVTDVYIFLLSVEEPDAAGHFKTVWFGNAALGWRNDRDPQPKKVGHISYECDLCHILKSPLQVQLSPIIQGQFRTAYTEAFRIALTLKAKGVEAQSDDLRIEISWNGKWSDDKVEMKHHLVIKEVPRRNQNAASTS